MTIKTVLRMGDPKLLTVSKPVEDPSAPEIHKLVEDMFDTMRHYQGAGLAAPQIGILKRVVIFGFDRNERYPQAEAVPETILINPEIKILSDKQIIDWEGCLSVPGMRGKVSRPNHIYYSGYQLDGSRIERTVNGFHARVVQHECDHLDGVLYVQRLCEPSEFGFIEELQATGRYQPKPCDD